MSGDRDERDERSGPDAPPAAAPEPPAADDAAAGVSGAGIEIIVAEDGSVIFTDLPPELQAILAELDPDSPRSTVCLIPEKAEE